MRFSKLCVVLLAVVGLLGLGCSNPAEPSQPPPLTITPSVATLSLGESIVFASAGANGPVAYRVLAARGDYFVDVSNCIGILTELSSGQVKLELRPRNTDYCYQARYTSGLFEVRSNGQRATSDLYFRY